MANGLPEYKRPPVIEVVLGVQFDPLSAFLTAHFGRFGEVVRADYPQIEDRPPLPDIVEGQAGGGGNVAVLDLPPLRRVFFIDPSGQMLMQVQPSRFLHNWRTVTAGDVYPRFPAAWELFTSGWDKFVAFVNDNRLGSLRSNQ